MRTPVSNALPFMLAAAAGFSAAAAAVRLQSAWPRRRKRPALPRLATRRAADEPLAWQQQRARETGRGRNATSPAAIPWRGWKDVLLRTFWQVNEDRLLLIAGGVVFYALLAVVPAITALVSCWGLFTPARALDHHLAFLADTMPAAAFQLVQEQVVRIAAKSDGRLTFAFLLGLGLALWSANAGMKAIFDALNIVYDETEKRSFVRLNLVTLTFTLGAIVVLLLLIGAVVVLPLVLAFVGFASATSSAYWPLLRWPALLVLVVAGLSILYRYGPSRRLARWRWISIGSIVASAAWLIVSGAFSYYLSRFADYNATYGSLGAVIGFMMWLWLSVAVVLVGAEIDAELEHQTARDTTVGPEKPLGAREAVMADTVGAAQVS
jgi:membrane protein